MRLCPFSQAILSLSLLAMPVAMPAQSSQQTPSAAQGQSGQSQSSQTRHPVPRTWPRRSRTTHGGSNGVRTLSLDPNSASSTGGAPSVQRQQAIDASILRQQQAQSSRTARINDQQVQQYQQRRDAIQSEQRIQSAPGPYTGVPVAPADEQRIQDAPGPGQVAPVQTVPLQTVPATLPVQPAPVQTAPAQSIPPQE